MNNKFDQLAKGLAQSVTRRQALKKFGVGLAGMALACFGLAYVVQAGSKACSGPGGYCSGASTNFKCCPGLKCCGRKVDGYGICGTSC